MRELVNIYNRYGIRGSFNAEVMQQLTFRRLQSKHPELRVLADSWDAHVRESFSQGHDIQLHVHPQWLDAHYDCGKWQLLADWSILNHDADVAYRMLEDCKQYLEGLLRSVDPSYRCVTFRSGAWCIAPSKHMLGLLVKLGIVFDMSIVGGLRVNTRNIQLDYTNCEESFLPYYPVMENALKVSDKREDLICVPTNHFYGSRFNLLRYHLGKLWRKATELTRSARAAADESVSSRSSQEWVEMGSNSTLRRVFKNAILPYWNGPLFISSVEQLNYPLLCEMLESIRWRAQKTGLREVPIVLQNHTKDIHDFSDINRFLGDVVKADDLKCVTLTELARDFANGRFPVRTAS
jgi:hypothetical protein